MTFWTLVPALAFLVAVLGLSGLIIGALRGEFNLKDPVWGVFIVALIIRVPLMIVLNRTLPDDWLDVDWMMYESVGRALAETGNIQPLMGEGLGALAYGLLNAAVFWMVGFEPLVVRAVNTILGALACALVYLFLERLTEQIRSARVGAYAVALWPTFVAWSTTNSKETVMALVAIAIFYCALTLSRRFRPSVAAMMAVLALSACFLRVYLVLLVLPLALTYIIILWTVRTHTLRVSIPLMATWLIAAAILLKIAAEQTVGLYNLGADGLDALNAFRSRVADGGAQMTVEPFESVYDLLYFLPQGVATYFLRPFPWEWGSLNQTMGALTMILYYPFLVMAIIAMPRLWRRERAFTAFFVIQVLVLAGAYGTMEGNLGSLMRHRAYIEVLILGIGVTYSVDALRRRAGHRTCPEDTSHGDAKER